MTPSEVKKSPTKSWLSTLRARLLLSYVLLLVLLVGVTTISLLVILNTRPAPPEQTYRQLATIALNTNLRNILPELRTGIIRFRQPDFEALYAQLDTIATQQSVRILIMSMPQLIVLFDSADEYATGDTLTATYSQYSLPSNITNYTRPRSNVLAGAFIDKTNAEWLYLALEGLSISNQQYALIFAQPRPSQSLQDALQDFGTEIVPLILQVTLGGLAIAVFLAVVISRNIGSSLKDLVYAADRVADGDYEHRVPVAGPVEVRAVAEAFNQMSAEVQSERKAQQNFLVNVSHDLKTPLTSIQGFAQAIVDGATSEPAKAAQIIYDEASRLNRMVVELTDLARLDAGSLPLQKMPIDLSQLVSAISQRLAIVAAEKNITLKTDLPPMPIVEADGDRLAQVVTNLIGNAIKFTPPEGEIHIQTRMQHQGVELIVRDSGIGITEEEMPRIFERFYQVDKARGPKRGTGLGLAIVREIIATHGGQVSVSSDAGQGSTFTVWLPSPVLKR